VIGDRLQDLEEYAISAIELVGRVEDENPRPKVGSESVRNRRDRTITTGHH